MTDNDEDDTGPAICSSCDGTGEAGRAGQLQCKPCKGSGEIIAGADNAEYDAYDDYWSEREHAADLRSDR